MGGAEAAHLEGGGDFTDYECSGRLAKAESESKKELQALTGQHSYCIAIVSL